MSAPMLLISLNELVNRDKMRGLNKFNTTDARIFYIYDMTLKVLCNSCFFVFCVQSSKFYHIYATLLHIWPPLHDVTKYVTH